MHLKSLEVQGFKSFPDRITLRFGDDITAIVGPNGSGKSNISDAIRWVMGEQSTRALRGAKMEDVIFGGTQKRPQLGFAEASLVFDNTDRFFPVDAAEVMVTRRYFRSGESEYYLNKQSARLRDINELFMDTGLGREGYSNISQGRIDEILALKSVDRREIFEEAAGISKFRHRKEETERRLERTEDNLLRINDKISELELQVEPLREQAEKARRFLELRDELRGVEVAVWLQTLEKLAATARKAEEDFASASFILQREHENLDALYQKRDELSETLQQRDAALETLRADISAQEAELQRIAGARAVLEGEQRNAEENADRLRKELDEEDSRSGGIQAQIAQRRTRLGEIDAETRSAEEALRGVETRIKTLTESAEGMNRSYLELRNRHAACTAELIGKQADLAALTDALERSAAQRDDLRADAASAAVRKNETAQQLAACRKSLAEAREAAQSERNAIAGYELRQKARSQKAETMQAEFQALGVQIETTASRLRLFREMEREYEGYTKAVKFVMQQAAAGRLPNIHGPVSRLIHTEDRYSVAVEIALGAAMQQIVVSAEADGKAAISLLKQRDMGRATFLPLTTIEGKQLSESGLERCRGYLGVASKLVRCEDRYRPIVENLLGRTVLTETLDDAISMARQYHNRFKIVTLDGQVMNPGGSMTGGSVSKNAGVLSRANEIERLTLELQRLQKKKDEDARLLAEANRQRDLVGFELNAAQAKLREAEDRCLRLEGEEKQYAVLYDAICQADDRNERELDALEQRCSADTRRREAMAKDVERLTADQKSLQTGLDALSVDQNELNREGTGLTDDLTQYKMRLSALAAEKLTAMESLRELENLSAAMAGDRSQKLELIAAIEARLATLQTQLEANAADAAAQEQRTQARRAELQTALTARAALEAERTGTDRAAQQKSKDILDLEREAARLETKTNTARMEEKQLIDKLWESYELTPSTAASQAAEIENVTAANRRVAELRRKIHALGTPNLGAIDEFARVSERYDYLRGQRDDVLGSKRELEGIIRDLTRHMTEIFTAEFAKINEYFGQTFVEMFGGGKASLELEDPNEPLACGIEIKVQPPGKQLKTITLLSGGEKAFVAIALYFAILKVRPTPFCMLDEIDAALDDRNVERFAGYLRQLCKKTQFIVITHRRGTMEAADALFGVTMQEQGVSKILQINLDALEKELGIGEVE